MNLIDHDQMTFRDGSITRVARQATFEKCGVLPQTVDLWAKSGHIDRPIWRAVSGSRRDDGTMQPGQTCRRAFYAKEQIDEERKRRGMPRRPCKPVAIDCLKFVRGTVTLIAREATFDECGVLPSTVSFWGRKGWIDKGEWIPVAGGTSGPFRRMFYRKEQIDAVNKKRVTPQQMPTTRTPTEIMKLHDEDFVTVPEMELMGIPYPYARKHWDYANNRRTRKLTPCPLIGRIFRTARGERVSHRGHLISTPMVRWGDIRLALHVRDNPPIPEGAILLRDAIPKLKQSISETQLRALVTAKAISGDKIDGYAKRNLRPLKLWWMKWSDRSKIRQYERPGSRCYWIDGKDYYPLEHEAGKVAGFKNSSPLRRYRPELGRHVITIPYQANTRSGDLLSVCDGDDLRTIREKRTGKRPKAPPRPASTANGDTGSAISVLAEKIHAGVTRLDEKTNRIDAATQHAAFGVDRIIHQNGDIQKHVKRNGRRGKAIEKGLFDLVNKPAQTPPAALIPPGDQVLRLGLKDGDKVKQLQRAGRVRDWAVKHLGLKVEMRGRQTWVDDKEFSRAVAIYKQIRKHAQDDQDAAERLRKMKQIAICNKCFALLPPDADQAVCRCGSTDVEKRDVRQRNSVK